MKKILLFAMMVSLGKFVFATTHTVNVANFSFNPNALSVMVGDTIIFQHSGGNHTTTSVSVPSGADTWDSPITAANPTFIYVVTVPGNYGYVCTPHADMGMAGGFVATVPVSVANLNSSELEFSAGINADRQAFVRIDNPTNADVQIQIMDITGKSVANICNGALGAGETVIKADMSAFNTGIYFVRMERAGRVYTKKVLLR
jgi:plastocyanin